MNYYYYYCILYLVLYILLHCIRHFNFTVHTQEVKEQYNSNNAASQCSYERRTRYADVGDGVTLAQILFSEIFILRVPTYYMEICCRKEVKKKIS